MASVAAKASARRRRRTVSRAVATGRGGGGGGGRLVAALGLCAATGCVAHAPAAPTLHTGPARAGADELSGPRSGVVTGRDAVLADARARMRGGDRAGARRLLDALLARAPDDDEARAALARLDAWEGHWPRAEANYRAVVSRHAGDDETRAGLCALLLWQQRYDEAERQITVGLAHRPGSAPLLLCRARLARARGDQGAAVDAVDAAARAAPGDDEARAMREQLFRGEARLTGRYDLYPRPYVNLPSGELQVMVVAGRFNFWARTEQSARFTSFSDERGMMYGAPAYNARYVLGLSVGLPRGFRVGLEAGLGNPAPAVPQVTVRPTIGMPITSWLGAELAYAFWYYANGNTVQVANPALTFVLSEQWRIEARYWFAYAISVPPAGSGLYTLGNGVHSGGVRVGYRPIRRLDLTLEYIYGVQLDVVPAIYQLISLRSHIGVATADVLLTRQFGLRPLYRLEVRTSASNVTIPIHTLELGMYVRW